MHTALVVQWSSISVFSGILQHLYSLGYCKTCTWVHQSCCCLLHLQKQQLYLCVFHCIVFEPCCCKSLFMLCSARNLSCMVVTTCKSRYLDVSELLLLAASPKAAALLVRLPLYDGTCIWISARSLSLFSCAFLQTSTSPQKHEHHFGTNVDTSKFDYGQWIAFHCMTLLHLNGFIICGSYFLISKFFFCTWFACNFCRLLHLNICAQFVSLLLSFPEHQYITSQTWGPMLIHQNLITGNGLPSTKWQLWHLNVSMQLVALLLGFPAH